MRALIAENFKGLEGLAIRDIESRTLREGEIRIKTLSAGLNFFDTLIIENKYQVKPDLPFSPSAEFCGIVTEINAKCDLEIGQRVAGYVTYGACREELILSPDKVVKVPEGVSNEQAAGVLVTYGTTLYALKNRAQLQQGESLLITGASGGVGLAAIELGKILGAHIIAAASNEEKLQICKDHGADTLLNYNGLKGKDLKDKVKTMTMGKGVDVIYDAVGADLAEPLIRASAWNGRYLVIGFAGGYIPQIPLNLALLKNMSMIGVFWGAFTEREPLEHQENMRQLLDLVARGQLKVHIGQRFSLNDAIKAITMLKERKAVGKLIINMDQD